MNTAPNSSKNVLSSDVEIKGNLRFSGELTLEGKLEGEINSDGTLQLGDSAVVNGNVNVGSIIVRGKHFRLQDLRRPQSQPSQPPRGTRRVRCFTCGTDLDVPATAQSTMCKRCSSHLDLQEYHITSTVSKNFKPKGRFVIEESG